MRQRRRRGGCWAARSQHCAGLLEVREGNEAGGCCWRAIARCLSVVLSCAGLSPLTTTSRLDDNTQPDMFLPPPPPPPSSPATHPWPPSAGARARVALTGLTVAEYFRDEEGQDVLLFVDNIFRFTQVGAGWLVGAGCHHSEWAGGWWVIVWWWCWLAVWWVLEAWRLVCLAPRLQ